MSGGYLTPQPTQRNHYARLSNSNAASSLRSIPISQTDLARLHTESLPMTDLSRRGSFRECLPNGDVSRASSHERVPDGIFLEVPTGRHYNQGYQNNAFSAEIPMTSSLSRSTSHSPLSSLRHHGDGSRRVSDISDLTPGHFNQSPAIPTLEPPADDLEPDYEDDETHSPDSGQQERKDNFLETNLNTSHREAAGSVRETLLPGSSQRSASSTATAYSKRTVNTDISIEEGDSGAGSLSRSSDEYNTKTEEPDSEQAEKWDIFREHPSDEGASCFTGLGTKIIRVTKVLVVAFLILAIVGGAILSKINFFFITEQFGKVFVFRKKVRSTAWINHYAWLLSICLSLPDVLKIIQTSWKIAFGKREKPARSIFIFMCVTEVLHAATMYGVTFRVFPFMTSSTSIIFSMAAGVFPALVGSIVAIHDKHKLYIVTRLVSFFMQCGAVGLCCYCVIFSEVKVSGLEVFDHDLLEFKVWAIIGISFLSVRWIRNYFPSTFCGINLDISRRTKGNSITSLCSSALRLLTAAVLLKLYFVPELDNPIPGMNFLSTRHFSVLLSVIPGGGSTNSPMTTSTMKSTISSSVTSMASTLMDNFTGSTIDSFSSTPMDNFTQSTITLTNFTDLYNDTTLMFENYTTESVSTASTTILVSNFVNVPSFTFVTTKVSLYSALEPTITHVISTGICYYCAILACKLCLQRLAFSLPLILASPILFSFLHFVPDIGKLFVWNDNHDIHFDVPDVKTEQWLLIGAFILAWGSQILMCVHIWKVVPVKRLAFSQQLFIMPHYNGAMADLSLMHSRRQMVDEPEVKDKEQGHPMIYICATMWHETEEEMMQILTSLFRLDEDQCAKQLAKHELKANIDYYEFEVHILFDDAMCDEYENVGDNKRVKTGRRAPNDYVLKLAKLMDEAASVYLNRPVKLQRSQKYSTPYGARIDWTFPGRNKFIVHLKDKDKIRHRKRWSQVMYMYYLLGFKLAETDETQVDMDQLAKADNFLHSLPQSMVKKADNTYILALDGDVDFKPEAVHLLVDRMRKNPDVAAACGRIKPKGSGPVVWYQKFEYAIGHWLQKSAEHVFGCVLCSPGCFSLFRARCLMDDNVMKTYTKKPVTARHHLQYDQGEDRWLCTLLLQQGYRVEYCAASEALTFAPEGFNEFFNQRRRWLPSTMANVMDLLMSRSTTVAKNRSISNLYIFYQTVLFASSVLGPATVLLAIESSVEQVFAIQSWVAYLIVYIPNVFFSFACLKFKAETQLTIAAVLSTLFALVMMAVIAGTMVNFAQEGWFTPNAIFLYVLVGSFVLSGLVHPHEFTDLVWGVLYFLCIPSGYLFLIIYSICNLNIISWGTREGKTVNEQQEEHTLKHEDKDQAVVYLGEAARHLRNQIKDDGNDRGCCSCVQALIRRLRSQLTANATLLFILEALTRMERGTRGEDDIESGPRQRKVSTNSRIVPIAEEPTNDENIDMSTDWLISDEYIEGDVKNLKKKEFDFWRKVIMKYLEPIDKNPEYEAKIKEDMLELRNNSAFAFFFLNGLWLVIMTALQEVKQELNIAIIQEDGPPIIIHPLGMLFLAIFALLLVMQMAAMMKHRYGTFLHLLAFTPIRTPSKTKDERSLDLAAMIQKPVANLIETLQQNTSGDNNLQTISEHTVPERRIGDVQEQDPLLRRYIRNTSRQQPRYRRDLAVSRDQREVVDYHKTFNRVYSTIRGAAINNRRSAFDIFDDVQRPRNPRRSRIYR